MAWAMQDECDLADEDLWAAIDSAAAAKRSAPGAHQSLSRSPVMFKQNCLVELPPSPEVSAIVPRTGFAAAKSRTAYHENAAARWESPLSRCGQKRQFESGDECHAQQKRQITSSRSPLKELRNRTEQSESFGVSNFPAQAQSSAVFKRAQDAAMGILEKGDYMMMHGRPFIKKSGWRKFAFFFNISFEIKDRKIEFDQSANVLRAEFVVRAIMQTGRFAEAWGSCDLREKRFSKPNHDIPSTAETRAKTRACQDLLGIGDYKGSEGW